MGAAARPCRCPRMWRSPRGKRAAQGMPRRGTARRTGARRSSMRSRSTRPPADGTLPAQPPAPASPRQLDDLLKRFANRLDHAPSRSFSPGVAVAADTRPRRAAPALRLAVTSDAETMVAVADRLLPRVAGGAAHPFNESMGAVRECHGGPAEGAEGARARDGDDLGCAGSSAAIPVRTIAARVFLFIRFPNVCRFPAPGRRCARDQCGDADPDGTVAAHAQHALVLREGLRLSPFRLGEPPPAAAEHEAAVRADGAVDARGKRKPRHALRRRSPFHVTSTCDCPVSMPTPRRSRTWRTG